MCKRRLSVLSVGGAGSRNDSGKSVVGSPLLLRREGAHLHRLSLHQSERARIFGGPVGLLACSGSSSPGADWCE